MPVHNGAAFLRPATDSLLRQTWRPIEIVVVDDGSTDDSARIAASFGDPVRFVSHTVRNPMLARNHGIGEARGEFLCFLDQDDLSIPERLALKMAAFAAEPSLDVCVGMVQRVGRHSTLDRIVPLGAPVPGYLTIAMLARRQAFDRVGLLNPAQVFSDSTEWFLRAQRPHQRAARPGSPDLSPRSRGEPLPRQGRPVAQGVPAAPQDEARPGAPLRMMVLAIGSQMDTPSWRWVGQGMADALRRWFEIVLFQDLGTAPAADLVLVVKQRPPAAFVERARRRGAGVFFAPIDVYRSEAEIRTDAAMLGQCDAVLVHSEVLRPYLEPYCRALVPVEHHGRFTLDRAAEFRPEGSLLWIGGFEHIPHVLCWLERHPPPVEVQLLTDLDSRLARITGRVEAERLGLALQVGDGRINGHPCEPWSQAAQARLMLSCRAALDIKGGSFNQMTKPPTKAQQFMASGIPFGCNADHPAVAYCRSRGFEPALASDYDRLLSRSYWSLTQRFAARLRQWTSLDAVAETYRRVLAGSAPALAS
jgi:glycosyltransferase involved in cell wall biosynthesis